MVWDDNPDTAAKLLAGTGYLPAYVYNVDGWNPAAPYLAPLWPRGACADPLPFLRQLIPGYINGWDYSSPGNQTNVFLHGLTSPGGHGRLVRVDLYTSPSLPNQASEAGPNKRWAGKLSKAQAFRVGAFSLDQGQSPPQQRSYSEVIAYTILENIGTVTWTPGSAPGQPGHLEVWTHEKLTVHAGQPDPTDPSHFTINYQLDAAAGTIDGWLRDDDSVQLSPRSGTMSRSSLPLPTATFYWEPHGK